MTVKDLSKLLEVSKNTINNKVKKLHIEPQIKGNRYELNDSDVQNIIKSIYPSNFQEYFDKANLGKTSKTESAKNEQIDKNDNQINQNDKNNAQNETETDNFTQKLIEMLQKSLEDKENTIRVQQNQINALISANASLSNKILALEDKSQKQPNDVVVDVQTAAAPTEQKHEEVKKHWWQKLFS